MKPGRAMRQGGVALVEVMVSMLVFSIGLIGTVALQAHAVRNAVDGEDRLIAAMLANEAVSLIWMARPGQLGSAARDAWKARVADSAVSGLQQAAAEISDADADGVVTITITWKTPARGAGTGRYVTQVATS